MLIAPSSPKPKPFMVKPKQRIIELNGAIRILDTLATTTPSIIAINANLMTFFSNIFI